jgi:hypothetical protein
MTKRWVGFHRHNVGNYGQIHTPFVIPDGEADPESMPHKSGAEPVQNGAPLPAGAVIAADYRRFTERLLETCAGLKVDPAALEYKDFTYVEAGCVEAGEMGGAMT